MKIEQPCNSSTAVGRGYSCKTITDTNSVLTFIVVLFTLRAPTCTTVLINIVDSTVTITVTYSNIESISC